MKTKSSKLLHQSGNLSDFAKVGIIALIVTILLVGSFNLLSFIATTLFS